jgi:hypothetical protein
MAHTVTPLKSSYSRVFLIEDGAGPSHAPEYHSEIAARGLTHGFGDAERIEVPDPSKLGSFIEVGEVRGAVERPTTTLEGRFPSKNLSDLHRLARTGCYTDVHVVIGACNDPRSYDEYDKILIFETARVTNYETDDLGALESGENAAVNERGDLSAMDAYEVVPVSYGVKGASVITNEVLDLVICDQVSCGDCETPSDGCQKIFGITKAAGGSPSTQADIIYSLDKGANWFAHDIESLDAAEDPDAIFCIGSYVVVISQDSLSLHYALKSEMDGITDPDWTEVATGFVAGAGPRAAWSLGNLAYIVGGNGYIYKCEDPTSGVTVVDAGSVTTAQLNKIHALNDEFAIAVGDNGAIIVTANGIAWASAPTSPVGFAVNLTCCWARSETVWLVGTSAGRLYYTEDAGKTWVEKTFTGSGTGVMRDIKFSTNSVGWFSHDTATPRARIFRTTNGGNTWKITPEETKILPNADHINALAYCIHDPNFIVGGGLADDGTDGIILVGAAV